MSESETQQSEGIETSGLPVRQQLIVLSLILLLIFGSGYIPDVLRSLEVRTNEATATVPDVTVIDTPVPQEAEDYFAAVSVNAASAFVWDVQAQKALYQKNPDERLPLASITKLMTALVAYELLAEDNEITISADALKQDGNSGFTDGETFSLGDLLDLMLLSSSNDGAYAIAAAVGSSLRTEDSAGAFVEAMNIRASELGLTQTSFRNASGLDISETESGAYSSARDVTFLFEHILRTYPEIIEETQLATAAISNTDGGTHTFENTNPTIDRIEGLIGSKTGYTELAGGNLAIAFDAAFNRPIIVVVLGSTYKGRFTDVLSLSDAARAAIQ